MGGCRFAAVRPAGGAPGLPRVPGPAGVRVDAGVRRDRGERAPPERVRDDAVAAADGGDAVAADAGRDAAAAGAVDRAVQPADAGGGGDGDARRAVGRAAGGGFPGGDVDGRQFLLRGESGDAAGELPGESRPDHQGVDGAGHLRVERGVQQGALREHLAAADPAAASAGLDSGRGFGGDVGFLRGDGLQLLVPVVQRVRAGRGADAGVLEPAGGAGGGVQSVPGGVRAADRGGGDG